MNFSYDELQKKAQSLTFENKAFIDGRYVDAVSGQKFACVSPRDGKELTNVASCDEKDVGIAVKSARKAFDKGVWSNSSPEHRKKVLLKFADLLEKHKLELALLETLDMGKPIQYSFNDDLSGAIARARWMAECVDKLYDKIAPTDSSVLGMITREPCGVVAGVVPWNFPLYLACAKMIPALAVGNSMIIKPAEQSPLSAIRLAELMMEAGLPEGVLSVLPGFGETVGKAIGLNNDIDVVSFTGSTEVGRFFLRYSAESNMKRILLECGGKSPNIVMADADVNEAAKEATRVFYNQGEVCVARSRLIVDKKIQNELIEKFIKFSESYKPGDPLDPKTQLGAMVDKSQTDRVMDYISIGQKEGAQLKHGGKRVKENTGGFYIEPTVFTEVNNDMRIAREEIFGPVVSVIGFNNLEEAIKIANDTHYGLAASLWTNDINKAHLTAKALRAGSVSVNCISTGNYTTTFGGYKQSGIGREGSFQDFNNYTEMKTTWIQFHDEF